MKVVVVNLNQTFMNIDESGPMVDEKGNPTIAAQVLRMALAQELKSDSEGDSASVIQKKTNNFDLMCDIRDAIKTKAETMNITVEQADYLKDRVARTFSTLIAGPMVKALSIQTELSPVAEAPVRGLPK